jgi:hypothetical protein
MKQPNRAPSQLSQSLHRRLNAYALAASAAGVGMLALAQPAGAKIVYTATHQKIQPNGTLDLDLNNDGVIDFKFVNYPSFERRTAELQVDAVRTSQNAVWQTQQGSASALSAGILIGPNHRFRTGDGGAGMAGWASVYGSGTWFFGRWQHARDRYLGFKFAVNGKKHYGWARLNVTAHKHGSVTGTLTGYAYETIPNKPIIAGKTHGKDDIAVQPASLGVLAAGVTTNATERHKEGISK